MGWEEGKLVGESEGIDDGTTIDGEGVGAVVGT